jgi:hypothetical protein
MALTIATEPVYADDANGIRRLIAAPGDPVPDEIPTFGVVTPTDPPAAALEPFAGYDALTEAEVLAQLETLPADDLEAVRAYERTHLARGSITRHGLMSTLVSSRSTTAKVPAESTSEGYDEMTVEDLQAEVDRRGLTVAGTGAGGNVLKKDLVGALQHNDATTDGS